MKKHTIYKHSTLFNVADLGTNDINNFFIDLVNNGNWEEQTFYAFDKYANKKKIMLDIGGWIGTTCLYCSDKFKEVYVFECDPKALKRLKLNIEANPSMTNIKLIEKAISSKVGKVNFFSNVDGGESSLVLDAKGMGEEIQIDTTTFDVFVKNSKINPTEIGFIKMDIEGAEAEVIPDMKEWLEKHKPVLHLSLHRDLNTIQEIENILDILCGIYPICLQFGIRGNSKKVEKNWILNNLEMSTNEYVFCIN